MKFKSLDHAVNVLAYKKDNINYAMTCAWCMNVDYDKLICLMGAQSVSGNNLKKGDILGFSALAKNQLEIALALGDNHSNSVDKLNNIDYYLNDNAILINNALLQYRCIVKEIIHLEGIEDDNLVYLQIIEGNENEGDYLHMSDVYA